MPAVNRPYFMTELNVSRWDEIFGQYRPYLISFAYRMTGSLVEAEDIVQDTFVACHETNPDEIQNHKSWLTKICANKALDHLKLAYKKREEYPGTWLPDAIPDRLQLWAGDEEISPESQIALSESLTTSFLLLVERLSPEERVIYLLREVFGYSSREISEFVGMSDEACRKVAERARKKIVESRPRIKGDLSAAQSVLQKFFESVKTGDAATMKLLLSENSQLWSDGGGKVSASRDILHGPISIVEFFQKVAGGFSGNDVKAEFQSVNHRPGLVMSQRLPSGFWLPQTVMSFEVENGQIVRIYAQRNPEKLLSAQRTM